MGSLGQGKLGYDRDLFDELETMAPPPFSEDTAQASIDALLSSADHYRSPGAFRELVRFVGRLPRYKPFNRMLVHLQDPGAVYVATPAKWRSDYGRGITPAARPIIVMQPRGPVMVVFDVRDTEPVVDDPPPVPESVTDPIAIRYSARPLELMQRWTSIEHNAIRDGIRVSFADHGGHSGGSTTRRDGSSIVLRRPKAANRRNAALEFEEFPLLYDVVINKNLSLKDQYTTLVHELGHIYCGHLGSPNTDHWPDRPRLAHEVEEVEAESVVHMLISRIDPDVEMGDYIQGHLDKQGHVPPALSLNAMMKAAGLIEEMGERRLPKRKPKNSDGR